MKKISKEELDRLFEYLKKSWPAPRTNRVIVSSKIAEVLNEVKKNRNMGVTWY